MDADTLLCQKGARIGTCHYVRVDEGSGHIALLCGKCDEDISLSIPITCQKTVAD